MSESRQNPVPDAMPPDSGQPSPVDADEQRNTTAPDDADSATGLLESGDIDAALQGLLEAPKDGDGEGDGQSQPDESHDRMAAPGGVEGKPRLAFAVVGLGASAGGLEAYTEFLQHMPSDSGMAFVLIQHLSPSRESMVAEILNRHTHMRVLQVEDNVPVEPNHVYVIRPGHTMTIKNGRLHLDESPLAPDHRRPVDDFFRSLAEEQQQRAIAVILSGMGSNGTAGAQAIKAVGGVCIAQDPDSAKFPSMPRHLIDAGLADFILQPKEIPSVLSRYASHPYARGEGSVDAAAQLDRQTLDEIVAILRTRLRHDLGGYKKPTVVRRVQRRMGLTQLTELQSSNEELETSKEELQSLNEELATANSQLQAKMEELERLSNDLASLLASTDIAVLFLDNKFRIRRFTPAIKPLMELIPSDQGRPLSDMARKFEDPAIMEDVRTVLDRLVPIERMVTSQAGRHYMRRALPYRTSDNRIDGVVVTFVDITEQHRAVLAQNRAEDELREKIKLEREARAMAEAASSAKDDFLANVSHELRTPLSAILLWAKMLGKGGAPPEQFEEGIGAIIKSAESQRQLIDDLLDTTRIASGKLRLNLEEVLLLDVVKPAVDAIRPTAENKSLTIKTDYGADIGVVRVDADRIRQVVWNLLSNAVKFTPAGGEIALSLRRQSEYVELRVSDTGKGIPPELLELVFERFRQVEPQESGARGGLGLGLTISRQLVELHGGTIEVQSDGDGAGSTFTVKLPLPKLADRHPDFSQPSSKLDMNGVRALLIEDDAPTRDALALVLRSAGMDVLAAASGKEALEMYRRHKPQVIVSDISMPERDGHAVMREVRRMEAQEQLPPVRAVAFSALSRAADRRQSTASGFDHHVCKPVDPDELLVALQLLLAQT